MVGGGADGDGSDRGGAGGFGDGVAAVVVQVPRLSF